MLSALGRLPRGYCGVGIHLWVLLFCVWLHVCFRILYSYEQAPDTTGNMHILRWGPILLEAAETSAYICAMIHWFSDLRRVRGDACKEVLCNMYAGIPEPRANARSHLVIPQFQWYVLLSANWQG